jgi:hypothetical protein
MGGMLRSTAELPRQTVVFVLRMYGSLYQNSPLAPQHYGKAMVWIMEDRTMVIVQNSLSQRGGVDRHVYPVNTVSASAKGMTITFNPPEDAVPSEYAAWAEATLTVVAAPCVCGAGPTGVATPIAPIEGIYIDVEPAKSVPEWINPGI